MSEEQKEYNLGIEIMIAENAFNPEAFGMPESSFNGTIYRTFNGKLTFKESNGVWVILASNGAGKVLVEDGIKYFVASKMPEIVFREKIESNNFAEKLFKSFEVK